MKVLVVDDDAAVCLLAKTVLEEGGHSCRVATGGLEGLRSFREERPDIVVLDIMMPRVDGFEVCRRIREVDESVPVLFLSAKSDITDKRIGFSLGADDYLVKPFDEEELLMRIVALFRRAQRAVRACEPAAERFALGRFEFDAVRHRVLCDGDVVSLTPKEFQLLYTLARHQGEVMGKGELVGLCWGEGYDEGSVNLASYIRRLRERIEEDPGKPSHLKTVWGVGYVFEA